MPILDGYRRRTLGNLRKEAAVFFVPGGLSLTADAQSLAHSDFQIAYTCRSTIPSDIALSGSTSCVDVVVAVLSRAVVIRIATKGFAVSPTIGVIGQAIPVGEFRVDAKRFTFGTPGREPRALLPFQQEPQVLIQRRVAKVEPPVRPPSPPGKSLEERLRWILTPPIQELLSDPQLVLPEKPYPFQAVGIKWLYDREAGLLADEMGLGKTMQAILAARLLYRARLLHQVLVICPKTLIPNWQTEIRKWWAQASPSAIVAQPGQDRHWFLKLGTPNVIWKIINYDAIQAELDWLESQAFSHDLIIIDEAQRIKNPKSKTARAIKVLKAGRRWALTGTPLENRIDDLVSLFGFVSPGLLSPQNPEFIVERIRPYMLRRRTDEVNLELPDKFEQDVEIELDPEHMDEYRRAEETGVIQLNRLGDTITVQHVFALIAQLRKICNFSLVTRESAKVDRLKEDLEEAFESKRKALVFSQFVEEEHGGIKRIAAEIQKLGSHPLQLHGQVAPTKRQAVIEAFQTDPMCRVLLSNYAVGGQGLNLQAASYVFLFDRWWNPAVEDQAVKRVHRIGQTDKVVVRKFYCRDTIEERILRKLGEKRRLFAEVIDEASLSPKDAGLTEEEVFSLFDIKVRPKRVARPPDGPPLMSLDGMGPSQFEELVAKTYEEQGYKVRVTGASHDRGVDVLAERTQPGGREKLVIQCKHQKDNVGRPALQQLWGVVNEDQTITEGVLVTSSGFTAEARVFAMGKRLTLLARNGLVDLVRKLKIAQLDNVP